MEEPKVIMVDIDGTLTVEDGDWGEDVYANRTPDKAMIKLVNEWYHAGHTIFIWTSRHQCDYYVTKAWLEIHGVCYNELIMGKPKFDWLLDDKALNAEDIRNELESSESPKWSGITG